MKADVEHPAPAPAPAERLFGLPMPGLPGIEEIDHILHAQQARAVGGVSPAAVVNAYLDWLVHLGNSPAKLAALTQKAAADWTRLASYAGRVLIDRGVRPPVPVDRRDRRFSSSDWNLWPFNVSAQAFLLAQRWWQQASSDVHGLDKRHAREVQFMLRQCLDLVAPANFPWSNPEVMARAWNERGMNLVRGARNLYQDWLNQLARKKPKALEAFTVGGTVAVTPGKVVFRNRLIELIQYAPAADKVWREPVLIVPAWIMKYYVLDLSADNSLVKYLVGRGHTVFIISWKNPTAEDRDTSFDDYRQLGVMAALDCIGEIMPKRRVHACGYCLGGTLLAITAATMARDGDDRLASLTLLAAETDFTEAGEVMLLIDESQLAYLEDIMWTQGFLDTKEMSSAFKYLRAADLIWSRIIRQYLLGEDETFNDLMAWNADATRMPYRMHSEYLRQLFLENRLATGKYVTRGRPVALTDIDVDIFALGTVRDHIAPWQSVFKIKILTDSDVTFVLAAGGHNAGIVSEPGHPGRSYQIMALREEDHYKDPERWRGEAPRHKGSWWPAWSKWLIKRSSARKVNPPPMGPPDRGHKPLADAPGRYVLAP